MVEASSLSSSLEATDRRSLESARACTGEDCAVEWEAVEEISAAKSQIENRD